MVRRPFFLCAIIVLSLFSYGQSASESVIRDLTDLKDHLHRAERERDVGFLQQVLADEFVAGTSRGDVLNKAGLLARVSSPDFKYDELHSDGVQIREYGNVAIMTDHTTVRGTDKGERFGGDFRFVRVFVRRHGEWQIVLAQGTPMQQTSSPSH